MSLLFDRLEEMGVKPVIPGQLANVQQLFLYIIKQKAKLYH